MYLLLRKSLTNLIIFTNTNLNNMSVAKKEYKRITVKTLVDMKSKGEKISMLTAYDYTMAKIVDGAGIDVTH